MATHFEKTIINGRFSLAMIVAVVCLSLIQGGVTLGQTPVAKLPSITPPAAKNDQAGRDNLAPDALLTLSAPFVNTTEGANFLVPVFVGDTTGLGVISYQFILNFNPAVMVPQGAMISVGGTVSDGMAITPNYSSPGVLEVDAFTAINRVGAGVLFYFRFTAVGPLNSMSPLTWQTFMFNEGNPTRVLTHGQVKIVGPTAANASVRGRLVSSVGQPVPYTHVTLTDSHGIARTALSNPFGYFEFSEVASGQSYVIGAETRRFVFAARIVEVGSDVVDLELVADP